MTTKQQAAQVSLPSDREVEVTRSFQAPRALVYEAYTKPELMKRWLLGPPGWSMPVCEMDVREGGPFRWRWRSDDDGREFGFHGEFVEVEPQALLRHTEYYDPGDIGDTKAEEGDIVIPDSMGDEPAMVTVRFDESDGVSTVTTRIGYASKEDRDTALATGMTDGMELSYQLLDELLAEKGAGVDRSSRA